MRRVFTTLLAVLAIAMVAPKASGQCSMTQRVIDDGYLLCAVGGSEWEWRGPDGFAAATICVVVTTPGTYTLRVFDGFNGLWSAPCSFTFVSIPSAPECTISGADSVCAGASTSWCGPSGDFLYAWTGPDGFSATSACVDVSAAGDYALTLTDRASGATGMPCARALAVTSCESPSSTLMCPSTARWWGRSCADHGGVLDAATFAQVAARVDERSAVWSYGGSAEGFCTLLGRSRGLNDGAAAKRHYAAVLANLSAGEMGVTAADGHGVGLDASSSLDGMRTMSPGWTVGDWVAATEARLLSLANASSRSRSVRDEYRRIARQGRAINHMAGTCGARASNVFDADDDDLELGGSTLASGAAAVIGTPRTDPLSGTVRMGWTLQRSETVELTIMDITGRRVRHLARGVYAAGTHDFAWDGRDDDGRAVRSGAYFVAGRVGEERMSQRLFILR